MKYMSFILTIFIIIIVIPSCSPETAPPEIEYITAEHYYEKRELLPSAEFRTIVNSDVIDWKDIYTTDTAIYALGMRKEPMDEKMRNDLEQYCAALPALCDTCSCTFLSTKELIPDLASLFLDDDVHFNEAGMGQFTCNLMNKLKSII